MKLYRSSDLPDRWIGEDRQGGLVEWPAEPSGFARRTPYTGAKRALEEVAPAQARGTGWPGSPRGPVPRGGQAAQGRTIRATDEEWDVWTRAAGERPTAEFVRDAANAAAKRKLGRAQ